MCSNPKAARNIPSRFQIHSVTRTPIRIQNSEARHRHGQVMASFCSIGSTAPSATDSLRSGSPGRTQVLSRVVDKRCAERNHRRGRKGTGAVNYVGRGGGYGAAASGEEGVLETAEAEGKGNEKTMKMDVEPSSVMNIDWVSV